MIDFVYIEGTRKTPSVTLDPGGLIKIQGRSIPEDASAFFEKVMDWMEKYVSLGNDTTRVDLSLEYFNSGTSKYILQILRILKELPGHKHNLVVNWFYESGDDDILERGEYYASILDIKINLIETE